MLLSQRSLSLMILWSDVAGSASVHCRGVLSQWQCRIPLHHAPRSLVFLLTLLVEYAFLILATLHYGCDAYQTRRSVVVGVRGRSCCSWS